MTKRTQTILIVDSNAETRARLTRELASTGCKVLEAQDGMTALEIVRKTPVRLVVSELFLKTDESDCLIQAIRQNRVRGTRTLAHTVHNKSTDMQWAKEWGASGFLIQPTRSERLRYVVTRLLTTAARSSARSVRTSRRDTLDGALAETERGTLRGTSSIVVGSAWWTALSGSERNEYRRRARRSGITLRSDAKMGRHFVELRNEARPQPRIQTARQSSPYRS